MTAKPAPLSDEQLKDARLWATSNTFGANSWAARSADTLWRLVDEHRDLRARVAALEAKLPVRRCRLLASADPDESCACDREYGHDGPHRSSHGDEWPSRTDERGPVSAPTPCTCALADDSAPVGLHQAQCGVVLQWSAEREVATRFGGRF